MSANNTGPYQLAAYLAGGAKILTKSDTNDIWGVTYSAASSRPCDGVYVGGSGDLAVIMANGNQVTFVGAVVGTTLPIRIKQLLSTGTSATLCLGLTAS